MTSPRPTATTPAQGGRPGRARPQRLDDDGIFFLQGDSPAQPTTCLWVAELRPAEGPDGTTAPVTLEALRAHVLRRLADLPSLRWHLVRVPFGLHLPVIAEDPGFDLDFHVTAATLPAPGGTKELHELVARLAEQRLDQSRPLWGMTLVEGMERGRQAVVIRLHHAFWDGAAGKVVTRHLLSDIDEPVPAAPLPTAQGRLRMVLDALRDHRWTLPHLAAVTWATYRSSSAVKARRRRAGIKVPKRVVDTPTCSINDAYTIDRRYSRAFVPVADVVKVKDAAGVTFNHVVLAIVASALRAYLSARGDLPDHPLIANVPVSSEAPDAPPRQWGNRFGNMVTSLATDVEDPWERLGTIAAVSREAKQQLDILGAGTMSRWAEFTWPLLGEPVARLMARMKRSRPNLCESSALVSNVGAWDGSVTCCGARVERFTASGPPLDGVGVNVTTTTSGGMLGLAVLAHATALDQPDELTAGFERALSELVTCAARVGDRTRRPEEP